MYKPTKTKLSDNSYTILNTIRQNTGGEFMSMTPLVKNPEDLKSYGLYVTGGGNSIETFMNALANRIISVESYIKSYENQLKVFKRGKLEYGETIENVWTSLVDPEGYTSHTDTPGDVYKQNIPDALVTFHPVNSRLVYETTTTDADLSTAFLSASGVNSLISKIVTQLYNSAEWDEYIMFKYVIARAILANEKSTVTAAAALTKDNSNDLVSSFREYSNNLQFMDTAYNPAGVATVSKNNDQICLISSKASAIIDVNSLAAAFNLTYRDFLGQRVLVNRFDFTEGEHARLVKMMNENVAKGTIPEWTDFTEAENKKLAAINGAIIDRDFFMIFDRLYQSNAIYDELHLSTNTRLHTWKIYSYNPFANCVFFADPQAAAAKASTVKP